MPWFDGTGPLGRGPRTGWGRGWCTPGRGFGRGFGRGLRFFGFGGDYTKEDEKKDLEDYKKVLREELEDVDKALKEFV